MRIDSNFDSGNIKVIDASKQNDIRLEINSDPGPEGFFQWFHFRVTGARDCDLTFRIMNAGKAAYAPGWNGYRPCMSYDRENWFRIDAEYADGILKFSHTPMFDSVYFAYFAPYSRERYRDFIARCQVSPLSRLSIVGETLDGEEMDMLTIGKNGPGKKRIWAIARQHPGETMASWWMEGFVGRLLDENDPLSRKALEKAVFYIVPNMNPDGSRRGHLRTNAAGANLNREWQNPTLERSPEVYYVANKMQELGLDFCLDVHGDEELPYNFIAGPEAIPSINDRILGTLDRFKKALVRANPDFQTEHGYPVTAPGKANLTMATAHIAETHGALAMTLEMPFKDNANAPDERFGWSPERCGHLGRGCLDAIMEVIDDLR